MNDNMSMSYVPSGILRFFSRFEINSLRKGKEQKRTETNGKERKERKERKCTKCTKCTR
jgi:hypothetical protein